LRERHARQIRYVRTSRRAARHLSSTDRRNPGKRVIRALTERVDASHRRRRIATYDRVSAIEHALHGGIDRTGLHLTQGAAAGAEAETRLQARPAGHALRAGERRQRQNGRDGGKQAEGRMTHGRMVTHRNLPNDRHACGRI
jgi:hypothetical protein